MLMLINLSQVSPLISRPEQRCLEEWGQGQPGERHQSEGEDAEGGAHDQREQGAEHQAHLATQQSNVL